MNPGPETEGSDSAAWSFVPGCRLETTGLLFLRTPRLGTWKTAGSSVHLGLHRTVEKPECSLTIYCKCRAHRKQSGSAAGPTIPTAHHA
jgi:hypothetical protein